MLQLLSLHPINISLLCQRLKWWQTIALHPEDVRLLMACFFGNADIEASPLFDEGGFLQGHHPWLAQLFSDLEHLAAYSSLAVWMAVLRVQPWIISADEDISECFFLLEVSVL